MTHLDPEQYPLSFKTKSKSPSPSASAMQLQQSRAAAPTMSYAQMYNMAAMDSQVIMGPYPTDALWIATV